MYAGIGCVIRKYICRYARMFAHADMDLHAGISRIMCACVCIYIYTYSYIYIYMYISISIYIRHRPHNEHSLRGRHYEKCQRQRLGGHVRASEATAGAQDRLRRQEQSQLDLCTVVCVRVRVRVRVCVCVRACARAQGEASDQEPVFNVVRYLL